MDREGIKALNSTQAYEYRRTKHIEGIMSLLHRQTPGSSLQARKR